MYAAVLMSADSTTKAESAGLMAHMFNKLQIVKDMGGSQWLNYDRTFREWAAAKNIRRWGEVNMPIFCQCLAIQQRSAPSAHPPRVWFKGGNLNVTYHTLPYSDLAVDIPSNPSLISMLNKKSKTDQGRKGAKVYLGRMGDSLCPIAALEAYLSVRGSNPGPIFQWESGMPLSKSSFVKHVKSALIQTGLPAKNYSGHNFRIGTATTAAVAGLEDSAIQILGRWESSAFKRYIRHIWRHYHLLSLNASFS